MDKPFRTIDEQIEILNSRGVITDEMTPEILKREGYYSVVNGYRDLYLDRKATAEAHEDRFDEGTTFQDIYRLFLFDRALRQTLFKYFAIAETTLKTQCAYQFTQVYQNEHEPYLNMSNYNQSSKSYAHWLIDDFKIALGRNPDRKPKRKAYMEHYCSNHDEVPLWVLFKYATLGQAFKFYCCQKESLQNKIAKGFADLYAQSFGTKKSISPRHLRIAYDHIKDFRNICAHEERLYCARVSPGRDIPVARVIEDLRLTLSKTDSNQLTIDVVTLLTDMNNNMDGHYFLKLLDSMGIDSLHDIMHD